MFADADVVVAAHGAGLTNTMFMRPGSSTCLHHLHHLSNTLITHPHGIALMTHLYESCITHNHHIPRTTAPLTSPPLTHTPPTHPPPLNFLFVIPSLASQVDSW